MSDHQYQLYDLFKADILWASRTSGQMQGVTCAASSMS